MSKAPDPRRVILSLASSLDVRGTLETFPGMTERDLREILRSAADSLPDPERTAVVWVDGAARGNPGEAGAGVVLTGGEGRISRFGEYLGQATNNEAEYRALILGMEAAHREGCRDLEVRSDSELMVRQLKGEYRVKSPRLQDLYFRAVKIMASFRKVAFVHVNREMNRDADRLANMAIDARGGVSLSDG